MRLPKYYSYYRRLALLVKALGVTIIYKDSEDFHGMWIPTRWIIYLNKELSVKEALPVLLHEVGHMYRDTLLGQRKYVDKAYTNYEKQQMTDKQFQLVMAEEKGAWDMGKFIAKLLKIPVGKWYNQCAKDYLKEYK